VRGVRLALTERERYAVADHVVAQLKEHGDPWHLSEEARPQAGPTTRSPCEPHCAWNEEDYVFLTNSWHQAVGLISPWTTLHAFGGWKSMQPSQRWSPFGVP
jgi:hypothetical protein